MRTHHNLAEIAGRYKDESVMPLAKAFDSGGEKLFPDNLYKEAHFDPIILGFILGRNWPEVQQEVLAAIELDLEYDRMLVRVSPKATSRVTETVAAKHVKGIELDKLEFKL